jgi:hypothetical protein
MTGRRARQVRNSAVAFGCGYVARDFFFIARRQVASWAEAVWFVAEMWLISSAGARQNFVAFNCFCNRNFNSAFN